MFVPSLETAKITIRLLDEYKDEEPIEDALKPDYKFRTPEDILQEHFAQHSYSEELEDLVTEFFFKIIKHCKYLTVILKEFFASKSPWLVGNPNEYSLYMVILYLLVIELNEMTKGGIEELLISLNDKKAFSVLASFKRSDTLTKLYELGCRIWDVEYVKTVLKNIIEKPLFQEVYETVAGHREKIRRSRLKELTIPVGPKCLTRPKKTVPTEVSTPRSSATRIPILIKASHPPSSTYVLPNDLERLEKARLEHREKARNLYEEAQRNAFRCANLEKSEKFKELEEEIKMERCGIPVKKTRPKKIKAKDPHYPKKTAAVILREGARLLKLEQEEIKRYEDLANGGFNNDLLAEWEEEMREETFRKHVEDIEKKHLEGLLSYEEALLAKQKCLKKKKECADEFRKEKETWLNQLEIWRKEEQLRIQESVEKGKALEKGAKEAMEQVKEEKHKMALETMEESRALKERWLKEKEEDLRRKVQLIKEIKALQALGEIKKKQTDFTETANLGFLYEMSLAELKERLFILRIELQEELEKRRAEVKLKRECRKEIVDSYQELIESHQKFVEEQKKRSECEVEESERKKKMETVKNSTSLESLRRKLYQKRRERLKQQIY